MKPVLSHERPLYYIEYYDFKTNKLSDISELGYETLEDCNTAIEEIKVNDKLFEEELLQNYEEKLRDFVLDNDCSDREPKEPDLLKYRYNMKPHYYLLNYHGYNEVTTDKTHSTLQMYLVNSTQIKLTYICINENGIEPDEIFTIKEIVGNFEQLIIHNQYSREITINPNQIES